MIKINRTWAMPNRHTFKIKPIKELLARYDVSMWLDPFAGFNSPCKITNDINKEAPTVYHEKALDFLKRWTKIPGVVFDPPYSLEQCKRTYNLHGYNFELGDTHNCIRWTKERNAIAERLISKGIVISFGWTSSCMGKKRGFEIIEILLVAHGSGHNDTIVTVERNYV